MIFKKKVLIKFKIAKHFFFYYYYLHDKNKEFLFFQETLLSNWKYVNPKSVYCTLLPNAHAASYAEPSMITGSKLKDNENHVNEQTQFQIHDSW